MADETPQNDEQETPVEAAGEEAPKRRGRARAKAPEAAAEETAAQESSAEKPKRRAPRTRAKAADGEADASAAAETPKPRRTRARAAAAEEAPAGEQSSTETSGEETEEEEAPKPRRTRARAAAAEEPAAEAEKPVPASPRRPSRARAARRPVLRRGRGGKTEPVRDDVLVYATARYVRSSARKARIVCDHIRGKSVPEARAILAFAPRAVAKDWAKLLNSAVANAEHNFELIGDELRIKEAYADEGPTLKRFRPRAMGRATPIHKKTSHLSITLTPEA
jgi:ribosomal protein L22